VVISFEEKQKAMEAGRLFSSPVLREVFDALDAEYVARWRASEDEGIRNECWHMIRAVSMVRRELYGMLEFAAVRERGKDEALNAAVDAAKKGK